MYYSFRQNVSVVVSSVKEEKLLVTVYTTQEQDSTTYIGGLDNTLDQRYNNCACASAGALEKTRAGRADMHL
jgi:hypothetical protein